MPFLIPAAVAFFTSAAVKAVATFALKTLVMAGLSRLATDLLGPKQKQAERQASITTLSLGETPRQAVFGRALVGGTLVWAWNYGGQYGTDHEVVVIQVADHLCDGLEGFFVEDQYYAYSADGAHSGFLHNGQSQLSVYWRPGTASQTFPAHLQASGGFTNDDLKGVAYLVLDYLYIADSRVFPTGRPTFRALIRGKQLYDPRKDSTVSGGSGAHRWDDADTWEWSENAYLCRYNWARGVFALDQVGEPKHLLVGRGLSAVEAPPERAFAPANLCDEDVSLKAGGVEKRYRVGGVIMADEPFIAVEEMFAAAMAGEIIQPEGTVDIAPGEARASVATITDDDLVVGEPVVWSDFEPQPDRVNTIIPTYVEPAQLWRSHAAPVRRVLADIAEDGGPHEEPLGLSLVTSGTQAQRCGEIRRRRKRRERRRTITLPPWLAHLEEGDWIDWTSARFDDGETRTWQIARHALAESRRLTVQLVEIAASDFSWTAASDEITPGAPPPTGTTPPDPLELDDVGVTPVDIAGVPGVRVTWDTPVDEAIFSIRVEVRMDGDTVVTPSLIQDVQSGVADITAGVGSGADLEVRLIPSGGLDRERVASAWLPVTATGLVADEFVGQGDLATLDQVNFGGSGKVFQEDGSTHVTNADVITELGTAAAFDGQGALSLLNEVGSDEIIPGSSTRIFNYAVDTPVSPSTTPGGPTPVPRLIYSATVTTGGGECILLLQWDQYAVAAGNQLALWCYIDGVWAHDGSAIIDFVDYFTSASANGGQAGLFQLGDLSPGSHTINVYAYKTLSSSIGYQRVRGILLNSIR